jgi:phosphotriesterase-related protein
VVILLLFSGCVAEKKDIVTVTGVLSTHEMGRTLVHEHILVDFIGADSTGYHRWEKQKVIEKVLPYLLEIKEMGIKTILECTPAFLGRDPLLLRKLSVLSSLNILTNTGFYGAVDDKYIPEFAFQVSADSLASIWIAEFEKGIEGTGIRPGFIKISVDTNNILSAIDEKIVQAAIITHRKTGLTITSHTVKDGPAFAQLQLLSQAKIDPQAWVWTHASGGTKEARITAAKKGAWISIDDVNKDELPGIIEKIMEMKSAGVLNRLLISHDAGWYDPDDPDGSFVAYTDIFEHLIPALKKKGFTATEIDQLLIENPKQAYQIRPRLR